MKLQTTYLKLEDLLEEPQKICSIALNPSNSSHVIASCFDKSLIQLNIQNFQSTKFISDPIRTESVVNKLSWQPRYHEQSEDGTQLVAACSDGSLIFFINLRMGQNFALREKKKVLAHEGSVTYITWSFDASSLLSTGEDGEVKVWSHTGHLKTVLASFRSCVNCLGWNYEGTSVITAYDDVLTILPFQYQSQKEIVQWKVSDEETNYVVLTVDWNNASELIVCGGEDCRYRIFDVEGMCLFNSPQLTYPVTIVMWIPSGEAFAIGSHNTIHLCDKEGLDTNHCLVNGNTSVVDMHFVQSSSKIIAGCSNGNVVLAHMTGEITEWDGFSVHHVANDTLNLTNGDHSFEIVPTADSTIIDFEISFEHLIVTTSHQCRIYHIENILSPVVIPLSGYFAIASMNSSNFALLNKNNGSIFIHCYSGRKISSFQCKDMIRSSKIKLYITLSSKHVGLVAPSEEKVIRLHRFLKQKSSHNDGEILEHKVEVVCIRICPLDLPNQNSETLAILDKNKDISIVSFDLDQSRQQFSRVFKIGSQMKSILWNETSNILASNSESVIHVYHVPSAPLVDMDLLPETIETIHVENCEKASITSFRGVSLTLKMGNGINKVYLLNQDPSIFFEHSKLLNWDECYRYCRYAGSLHTWASLACLALVNDNLEMAESAFVELKKVDKVNAVKHIRQLPDGERKLAEKHLYKRNFDQAMEILQQCSPPDYYRILKTQITLFKWSEALQTAKISNDDEYLDIVLWYRAAYLRKIGKVESEANFISLAKTRSIISKERLSQLKSTMRCSGKAN